ncbi:uncharacterized protein MELLADRAFT_90042 [Melampsora larici-populina 98AG31]|uniref:Cytoplasmic tRNA 2-thiolation protein 2 n=1 Tax=Melampsora larici-populina (strain 98AG31 / pathotype 3-4-7) TaxID=747676 RepID=F4RVI5_MELLP|nr:uncharacterized protein MELLADRAFT_90042 [Melampsora larici-populina 98AG31]EGG03662.1 hypothetical protein MELLADRAFT_90042 [Melampsora larici-populina 98AG31]
MAIDTLVGVSLGGGWGIAEQIGGTSFSDNVFICRPILQMVDAEVHHYILLNNLASHSKDPPSPTTVKTSKTVTIPSLITDFITKLEGDYPMTSSVINRAANKIGYRSPNTEGTAGSTTSRICPSCRLPSDPCANSWKKSITLASHSTTEPTLQSKPDETTMNLADHLCYSCMGTFCDQSLRPSSTIQSTSPHLWTQFPDYVLDSIDQEGKTQETRNYEEMRKKIEDYLIDPDSI